MTIPVIQIAELTAQDEFASEVRLISESAWVSHPIAVVKEETDPL